MQIQRDYNNRKEVIEEKFIVRLEGFINPFVMPNLLKKLPKEEHNKIILHNFEDYLNEKVSILDWGWSGLGKRFIVYVTKTKEGKYLFMKKRCLSDKDFYSFFKGNVEINKAITAPKQLRKSVILLRNFHLKSDINVVAYRLIYLPKEYIKSGYARNFILRVETIFQDQFLDWDKVMPMAKVTNLFKYYDLRELPNIVENA